MLTKLGAYLRQENIQKPMRYVTTGGDEFVVMPAKHYAMLTDIDSNTLPVLGESDTIGVIEKELVGPALAHVSLEEEIGVEDIPL